MQESPKQTWISELHSEVTFWRSYLENEGGQEFRRGYRRKLDPTARLDRHISFFLDGGLNPVQILDVGAGPLTSVGKRWRRPIHITAIDPLADIYNQVLDELGVVPLVRTQRAEAEKLSTLFPANTFDITHARNSLDHSHDPIVAIREMIKVTKDTGNVILSHSINEAVKQNYHGLHQWNFNPYWNDLHIWNKRQTVSLRSQLESDQKLMVLPHFPRPGWVFARIWKSK